MEPMRLDLHLHSHVSDGQLAPAAVVRTALDAGLDVIALTDHDTAAGVAEAQEAAAGTRLRVIPGIEVSTRHGASELHILGYWVDPQAAAIREHQHLSVHRRVERVQAMIARLQGLGVKVEYDTVRELAGPATRSLGRPHLARALLAGGQIRTFAEAFDRFLAEGKPGFVAQGFPSVAEAVEMIHAAGGVAVWAHPPLDLFAAELPRLAAVGLDGVECYRPAHLPADVRLLEAGAREHGLLTTGGSDWHGPNARTPLGEFHVREDQVAALLAAAPTRP